MNKEQTSLTKKNDNGGAISPVFVAEKKCSRKMAEVSREIAQKAFGFFEDRGVGLGTHLEDWFKAESEILRPAPVEITETDTNVNITKRMRDLQNCQHLMVGT